VNGSSFESVAVAELSVPGVTRRMMFGRDTLLVEDHPYAFLDGDRVALKLPGAAELVAAGVGIVPVMGTREMRQWVAVPLTDSSVAGVRSRLVAAREFVNH
jgi:hypothetical protein